MRRVGFGKPPAPCDPKRAILVPTVQEGWVSVASAVAMRPEMDVPVEGAGPGITRRMVLLHRFEAVETHQRSKGALHLVKTFATLDGAKSWLKAESHRQQWGNGWVRWVRAAPLYADAMLLDAVEAAAERAVG